LTLEQKYINVLEKRVADLEAKLLALESASKVNAQCRGPPCLFAGPGDA